MILNLKQKTISLLTIISYQTAYARGWGGFDPSHTQKNAGNSDRLAAVFFWGWGNLFVNKFPRKKDEVFNFLPVRCDSLEWFFVKKLFFCVLTFFYQQNLQLIFLFRILIALTSSPAKNWGSKLLFFTQYLHSFLGYFHFQICLTWIFHASIIIIKKKELLSLTRFSDDQT